jgi:polysaccharide biosynthesis protein PslJ
MIFLIPFPNIIFKVNLPANASFDRVFLVVMVGAFVASRASQKRPSRRRRLTPVEVAMLTFAGIALLSIVLNIDRIYQQNQVGFVEKGFSQLVAYGAFFFVVVGTIRSEEMPAFSRLILVLSCLTALGTIYEGHTGYNVFYHWSGILLRPIATVGPSPTQLHPSKIVVGPTQTGLALASMLTIGLPFAVLSLLEARTHGKRLVYLVAVGVILTADLTTFHKTAIFAPLTAFVVLAAYKRQILRAAPIAIIVLIPIIHFASPGALGGITSILPSATTNGGDYTDGRAGDYAAVAPDILNNLIIGRGYSTMDVLNERSYRTLDNQYLDTVFEVGVVGLVAYLAVMLGALMTSHGVIKRGGVRAPPALAGAAGCAAFAVVSATYDAAGFPQAIYSFLFAAGLIAVAASKRARRPHESAVVV